MMFLLTRAIHLPWKRRVMNRRPGTPFWGRFRLREPLFGLLQNPNQIENTGLGSSPFRDKPIYHADRDLKTRTSIFSFAYIPKSKEVEFRLKGFRNAVRPGRQEGYFAEQVPGSTRKGCRLLHVSQIPTTGGPRQILPSGELI